MNNLLVFLATLLLLSSCSETEVLDYPLDVRSLTENTSELDGKLVRVEGVLSMVPSLRLYQTEADMKGFVVSKSLLVMYVRTDIDMFLLPCLKKKVEVSGKLIKNRDGVYGITVPLEIVSENNICFNDDSQLKEVNMDTHLN
ncbi:hypothetical protein KUL49_20720 [Alteromonas sp. KUL49]|nr:hypothetical protein KUL49_20720 [Alteromonas sp. KUL49]